VFTERLAMLGPSARAAGRVLDESTCAI